MKSISSNPLTQIPEIIKSVRMMPKVSISFHESVSAGAGLQKSREVYESFTQMHRYLVIRKKTTGVALVDFKEYKDFSHYLDSINGKNSGAYYARKAKKRSYEFSPIDRNAFKDDIHEINTSAEYRQNRKMADWYLTKQEHYEDVPGYKYFGVLNEQGKLVAYCNVAIYGEFGLIPQLLGNSAYLNDGIMYYMLTEVVRDFYENQDTGKCRYLMYDTFLGASEGLQKFKKKLGFKPYRVKWNWKWETAV